jgi:hypothetical protein
MLQMLVMKINLISEMYTRPLNEADILVIINAVCDACCLTYSLFHISMNRSHLTDHALSIKKPTWSDFNLTFKKRLQNETVYCLNHQLEHNELRALYFIYLPVFLVHLTTLSQ